MLENEINKFDLIKEIPFKEAKFNRDQKTKLEATLVI